MAPFDYGAQFIEALDFGRTIGLTRTPLVDEQSVQPSLLEESNELICLHADLWRKALPEYHGNQCMEISSRLYALLNSNGIAADIVVGSVSVRGQVLYDITPELIKKEVMQPSDENSGLSLHAWISLGGDSIIDYSLPSMLVEKMGVPRHFWKAGFVESAADLSNQGIEYRPMAVSAQILGLINSYDPQDLLQSLMRISQR